MLTDIKTWAQSAGIGNILLKRILLRMGSDSEVVHHPVKDALLFPQYLIDFDSNFIWEDVAFVREGITFAMKAAVTWDKIFHRTL